MGKNGKVYQFGAYYLDSSERLLLRNGKSITIKSKVFDLLLLLVERNGRLVTKDEIMKEVWKDSFVEDNNLTVSIAALRRILGDAFRDPLYIETVPRRGYRFIAKVISSAEEDATSTANFVSVRGSSGHYPENKIRSLAVLPIINASEDSNLEYLSDGITEGVINKLSHLSQLKIIARSAVFRYKGQSIDPLKAGRELRVEAVCAGRILQCEGKLVIRVELTNVRNETHIWGEQYAYQFSDIFDIQEEIATAIAEKLRVKLTVKEQQFISERHTGDRKAYNLYLMGRHFYNRGTESEIRKAIKYFERAIESDAGYALAYAGLAESYNLLHCQELLSTEEAASKIKTPALKALQLDSLLVEAHSTLLDFRIKEFNWNGLEEEFRRIIKINPNYAPAHQSYALYLRFMGRFGEAEEMMKTALELDPLSPVINSGLSSLYYFARQYDKAIEQASTTNELEPNFPPSYITLGLSYQAKGMFKEAIKAFQKAISLGGNWQEATAYLGYTYAVAASGAEAQRLLSEVKEISKQKYISPYFIGLIYLGLKQKEQTLNFLEEASEKQDEELIQISVDPKMDALRSEPRFENLLRRIGFQ